MPRSQTRPDARQRPRPRPADREAAPSIVSVGRATRTPVTNPDKVLYPATGAERVIAIDRFPYRLRMAREQGGAETLIARPVRHWRCERGKFAQSNYALTSADSAPPSAPFHDWPPRAASRQLRG